MGAAMGRFFPRGWKDFVLQLGIWFGFFFAYQVARGVSDRSPSEALENGRHLIDVQRALHTLVEPDLQRVILHGGDWLVQSVNWTYWFSQFAVLSCALLWIYFRRNDAFVPVRNWILATNVIALVGYVLMPTAPPRMFPEEGFVDTLLVSSGLNHESGLVQLAANPYAAMPSVHAADALIIGFAMATLVRSPLAKVLWTLWPTWVWFSVMATGNHFWLDIAGGVGVAAIAAAMLTWLESRRGPAEAVITRRW
jgi:membrane-associated phospholipid phosphatase